MMKTGEVRTSPNGKRRCYAVDGICTVSAIGGSVLLHEVYTRSHFVSIGQIGDVFVGSGCKLLILRQSSLAVGTFRLLYSNLTAGV